MPESSNLQLGMLLAVAIASGVVLRFTNLDGNVFWLDETLAGFRVAGYTSERVAADVRADYLAAASAWTRVDMQRDWKVAYPFD